MSADCSSVETIMSCVLGLGFWAVVILVLDVDDSGYLGIRLGDLDGRMGRSGCCCLGWGV